MVVLPTDCIVETIRFLNVVDWIPLSQLNNVWRQIIYNHFLQNRREIEQEVCKWSEEWKNNVRCQIERIDCVDVMYTKHWPFWYMEWRNPSLSVFWKRPLQYKGEKEWSSKHEKFYENCVEEIELEWEKMYKNFLLYKTKISG